MAHIQLTVEPRTPDGSRGARRLRRTGRIPGVLYQHGRDPVTFEVDDLELRRAVREGARHNVIDVLISGAAARPVLLKDWQVNPVRGDYLHIDLQGVDLTQEVEASVPIVLIGDPIGVREGGILDQTEREVTVRALPDSLPEAIEYDVSELDVGDSFGFGALVAPEGVELIFADPDESVASITLPAAEIAEEAAEAEAGDEEPEADQEPSDDDE